jgi:hypothetical protein
MPRASQAGKNCWCQRTIKQKESPTWGGARRLEACRARASKATLGRVHALVCDAGHAPRTTIEDELNGMASPAWGEAAARGDGPFCKMF